MRGELDFVGNDGSLLVFIEVKTRGDDSERSAKPEDGVTKNKQPNLARMA